MVTVVMAHYQHLLLEDMGGTWRGNPTVREFPMPSLVNFDLDSKIMAAIPAAKETSLALVCMFIFYVLFLGYLLHLPIPVPCNIYFSRFLLLFVFKNCHDSCTSLLLFQSTFAFFFFPSFSSCSSDIYHSLTFLIPDQEHRCEILYIFYVWKGLHQK